MNKELEKIKEKIGKIQKEQLAPLIARRNELRNIEEGKAYLAFVGKVFVYRDNCYSCPEKPDDYWDIYVKVVDVFDGGMKTLSVQKTAYGFVEIKLEKSWGTSYIESLEECSESEFEKEYNKLMKELQNSAGVEEVIITE